MYVDECGDPGKYVGTNSKHYALSGLIISQEGWYDSLSRLKSFRKKIRDLFGLRLREEIHASELIRVNKIKEYRKIKKYERLKILELHIKEIPLIFSNGKIINIFLKKENTFNDDYQKMAWERIIQRYDNFLKRVANDKGIIITDMLDERKIRNLSRKMRIYNQIPSHYGGSYQQLTDNIIEDVFVRDSKHSYFIQAVDSIVHALYRKEIPKISLKKYNIDKYFDNLESITLKEASRNDPLGIVRK